MGERAAVLAVKVGARARTQKYSVFFYVGGLGDRTKCLKQCTLCPPSYSSFLSTLWLDLPLEGNFSSA